MSRSRVRPWLAASVWIAALLLIAATLIPIAESNRWWVRVLIFPQAQFTILLLLVASSMPVLLGVRRTAPKLLLALVVGCLAYQLHYLLPYSSKLMRAPGHRTVGPYELSALAAADEHLSDQLPQHMLRHRHEARPMAGASRPDGRSSYAGRTCSDLHPV